MHPDMRHHAFAIEYLSVLNTLNDPDGCHLTRRDTGFVFTSLYQNGVHPTSLGRYLFIFIRPLDILIF